jgi:tRNA(Ile)-lysidine synthase
LAAMPEVRKETGKRILRPLLDVPRSQLLDYAHTQHLKWVEDESNDSLQYDRNFLRHQVLPILAQRFAGYRSTLSRTTVNLAEAAELLEQIAREDAAVAVQEGCMDVTWLRAATPERAMNLLRWWIENLTGLNPGSARLHEMLNQLCHAKPNAQIVCRLGDAVLRRYRQFAYLDKGIEVQSYALEWHGEPSLGLPDGRQLLFREAIGEGIDRARILYGLRVTSRLEGASLRISPNRPKRSLKNLWQEAGIPPWERDCAPLIWHGDELIAVLGLGIDCGWQAKSGEVGLLVE